MLYNDDVTIFEPLPRKKKFKSTKPGFFREILKEIKDLSYLIDNDDVFSEALEHLYCIKKNTSYISVEGKKFNIRTFKNGFKKEYCFPFTVALT